ncbi:hypothetical protein DKC09_28060 [Klebsiella quasipneumoniae]|uniref:Uncharacterized protein n=1 Tax=Klebsiella quasipneumoniae TaxID=1463165 RepID=A0AAI8NK38_9ENTR|nr:hypothetical protein DKC11_24400 [Klebsiella quasipneumoniae]AWL61852.1 hypothetical protein DKC00_08770 [Klebsiella quasipneumoniae]AWL76692.1 hypothetical protein DKC09_28060 [Klebsiella quasipneumoniae]
MSVIRLRRQEDEHIPSPSTTSSTLNSPSAAIEIADQTSTPGMILNCKCIESVCNRGLALDLALALQASTS